jgi:hypothetical protein
LPILSTWSMPILDSIDFSNLTNYIYIYVYIYIYLSFTHFTSFITNLGDFALFF